MVSHILKRDPTNPTQVREEEEESDALAQARDSRSSENLIVSTGLLSLKRPIPRLGETPRIFQFQNTDPLAWARSSRSSKNLAVMSNREAMTQDHQPIINGVSDGLEKTKITEIHNRLLNEIIPYVRKSKAHNNVDSHIIDRNSRGKSCIVQFIVEHKHETSSLRKTHLHRSHRKIAPSLASEVDLAESSSIAPKASCELMARRVGGRENLGFIPDDYKN
ncbi:hypothetical protein Lal_00033551 [Lupinus albus]|nr:hypothetical protein Lal_00033551 [Lupinus albus]